MIDRGYAISKINPNAKFIQKADGTVEWLEGTTPISEEDINAKIEELKISEPNYKE
jgi:hypothetical protein|tara:strand:+ start:354 stop:521 length:168 start_codon:yes stop_codon:yes gene_type:complete